MYAKIRLARILIAEQLLDDAETIVRETMNQTERIFGKGHPNTAPCLFALAMLNVRRGQPQEADEMGRRMVLLRVNFQRVNGTEHPMFRETLANYTIILKYLRVPDSQIQSRLSQLKQGIDPGELPLQRRGVPRTQV